jgi:hypothetical protein
MVAVDSGFAESTAYRSSFIAFADKLIEAGYGHLVPMNQYKQWQETQRDIDYKSDVAGGEISSDSQLTVKEITQQSDIYNFDPSRYVQSPNEIEADKWLNDQGQVDFYSW